MSRVTPAQELRKEKVPVVPSNSFVKCSPAERFPMELSKAQVHNLSFARATLYNWEKSR